MMAAYNVELDLIVGARYKSTPPWLCPVCRQPVHRRQGSRVCAHYAHFPGGTCDYGEGETEEHMRMKDLVAHHFGRVELEVPVSEDHRADALVTTAKGGRFVVECQATPMSPAEWEQRTEDYNDLGFPVMWLWGMSNFNGLRPKHPDEYAVRAGALYAHATCNDLIYTVDSGQRLLATTLGDAFERPAGYVGTNEDIWLEERTPTTFKRWLSRFAAGRFDAPDPSVPLEHPYTFHRDDVGGMEIVHLGDGPALHAAARRKSPPFTWHVSPPVTDNAHDWVHWS